MRPFQPILAASLTVLMTLSEAAFSQNQPQDSNLRSIRYQLGQQNQQLQQFEQRISNQDLTIEALENKIDMQRSSEKKTSTSPLQENRLHSLESSGQRVKEDVKTLQTHANQTRDAVHSIEDRLDQLEKSVTQLDQSLRKLLSALGEEETISYKVEFGDSLEKIARKHKTTIRAIKELNDLKNDRIISGQTLKIPNGSNE